MSTVKRSYLNDIGQRVKAEIDAGNNPVTMQSFNDSQKYLNYMGSALTVGAGLGLSWHSLKKIVERAYRTRLEKEILKQKHVEDTYTSTVTPVRNRFVGADTPVKSASRDWLNCDANLYESNLNNANFTPDLRTKPLSGAAVITRDSGVRSRVAAEMARSPLFYHTLAFASVPALCALGMWGGNSMSKAIKKQISPDTILDPLDDQKEKAQRKYDAAALLLRRVAADEERKSRKKRASLDKEAVWTLAPYLYGAGIGGALMAAGAGIKSYLSKGPVVAHVPSPEPTSSTSVNTGLKLLTGLAALSMLYPGYRFVQSMRKGYKDRVEGLSDVTRSSQAWDALRSSRSEDYATLQARLSDEPDLLEDDLGDIQEEMDKTQR